jgi:hypothetical protein
MKVRFDGVKKREKKAKQNKRRESELTFDDMNWFLRQMEIQLQIQTHSYYYISSISIRFYFGW